MTPQDIQDYITSHGYNYKWLADKSGVKKSTVASWFSRSFPAHRLAEIERIIQDDQQRRSCQHHSLAKGIVAFWLTTEQFSDAEKQSNQHGLTVDEYARRLLLERLGYDDVRIRY